MSCRYLIASPLVQLFTLATKSMASPPSPVLKSFHLLPSLKTEKEGALSSLKGERHWREGLPGSPKCSHTRGIAKRAFSESMSVMFILCCLLVFRKAERARRV